MAMRVVTIAGALLVLLAGLIGCADNAAGADQHRITVTIKEHTFHLEPAVDEQSRMRGLGGRESIADDGGMIFIFPEPQPLSFFMRDCLVDIDIIFIDGRGRITAMHAMAAEPLQRPEETEAQYLSRLENYSSGTRAQFAIEVQSGWLEQLDLSVQDKIELDLEHLKDMAR